MARLMYREDGRWKSVEGIEKVASGSLVGAPGLDPEEVEEEVTLLQHARHQTKSSLPEDQSPDDDDDVSEEDWKLKQSPKTYLANSPKGPQAKLAQQLVDAGLGDITAEG